MFVSAGSALGLAAFLMDRSGVLLLAFLFVAFAVAARFHAARNLADLVAERQVGTRAEVGRPLRAVWSLRNGGHRVALGVQLWERMGVGVQPRVLGMDAVAVPAAGELHVEQELRFAARGWTALRRLQLLSTFPFAVAEARREFERPARILVRPRRGRPGSRLRSLLQRIETHDARIDALLRRDEEFYGIRDWRDGDDPRRLHAASTARRGTPVVSEWRGTQRSEFLLVLDTGVRGPAFERAVSVVATLLVAAATRGLPTRLVLDVGPDGSWMARGKAGRAHLGKALDLLAAVAPTGRAPLAALAAPHVRQRRPTAVLVSSTSGAAPLGPLARYVGRGGRSLLLRTHRREELAGWVEGLP